MCMSRVILRQARCVLVGVLMVPRWSMLSGRFMNRPVQGEAIPSDHQHRFGGSDSRNGLVMQGGRHVH